jgi:glycogen operon protein
VSGPDGAPAPLGVVLTPRGGYVAVYSAHASAVYFCLYDEDGERETARVRLHADANGVHSASIDNLGPGARYGLRADGPFDPLRGNRFDVSKLLADPYAAAFDRPFRLHESMFAFGVDSGPHAPKAIAQPIALAPAAPGRQRIPWNRTVIYEANLRGLTKLRDDVPETARGCFAGLADSHVIAHLSALGVTTVEIMPADAFVDERHLPSLGLANAWGYNPVVLGAPDPRLAPGGWAEVRAATDALHAAGMEAILDVVLNHNGESDEFGPTLSFRGLDNASYFRLVPDDPARYVNDMGCGNCLALDRPIVTRMALAALKRWMVFGGIDGFRFDLAVALGRRSSGFDPQAPMFAAIAADPILSRAKLIAEPWDVGPDGYRLGAFPEGWGEWNDRFRDAARRFWRGDAGMRGELATRLAGSRDVFAQAPSPAKSVNYVVAHDGFALADLVAYAHKHNEANGEHNRDGTNDNHSWNHGVEGPSDDAAVNAARARDMRNLLALPFIAKGTPMLAMGSEMGHSQSGNNNAYAQDNAISWIDWRRADTALIAFTRRLVKARREHPALSSALWLTGRPVDASALPDVEWRDAEGPLTSAAQWQAPDGDVLVVVLAAPAPDGIDRVAVAFNRRACSASLVLPEPRDGKAWRTLLDTGDDSIEDVPQPIADRARIGPRATLILAEGDAPAGATRLRPADAREIDALAAAVGISADWWDVAGRRTVVSPETKLALLAALRLPAGSQAELRESLARLVDETGARRLPLALVRRIGEPIFIPARYDPSALERPIEPTFVAEDGQTLAWRAQASEARARVLADGRTIAEREIALPELPIGRHRLILDGVECALTVAPPEAYGAKAALRRRFGLAAQLYALRRNGGGTADQGIGDFTTLGLAGEQAGRAGAAYLGINPLHAMFETDRARCSPYHPSDRRFLDPIHIDVLDDCGLPRDAQCDAALAVRADAIGAAARLAAVDYDAVWTVKRAALAARFIAFERARANRPDDPLFADHARFVGEGGEALRRFAIFQAIARERRGEDWRLWPQALRDAEPEAMAAKAVKHSEIVDFVEFTQWLADRQLAGAAARAKAAGLDIGLYRDLAVGAAPDGAESWARARELALHVSVGAPPDPFSAQGQVWNVQPPDPIASARDGWRGFCALLGANMRHAGMLRIDHAMGLTRLFVVPDGARPAEGAYLSYPLDDLIGHVALESQRRACMVVGEDLGTVPEGFRETLTRADVLGMRVLWFERRGVDFLKPADYPALSVACVATHDLPTLAGWWLGADIAERLGLGLVSLDDAQAEIGERLKEKRALAAALLGLDLITENPDFAAPMSDELAAAVHAFLAGAGSLLASAQLDDLSGERTAANLPGTDRERPNWRHRHPLDVDALFAAPRAKEILAALAARRK